MGENSQAKQYTPKKVAMLPSLEYKWFCCKLVIT